MMTKEQMQSYFQNLMITDIAPDSGSSLGSGYDGGVRDDTLSAMAGSIESAAASAASSGWQEVRQEQVPKYANQAKP
jgi:hypothetical protein